MQIRLKSQQSKLVDWALELEPNPQSGRIGRECLILEKENTYQRPSDSFQLLLFPEIELASCNHWLAGRLIGKQGREGALTLDSLFPLQFPRPVLPFNTAPLCISPWQLRSMSVCEWGGSHGFSAINGLRDSRHVQMVFVRGLNDEPRIERWHFLLNRGIWWRQQRRSHPANLLARLSGICRHRPKEKFKETAHNCGKIDIYSQKIKESVVCT